MKVFISAGHHATDPGVVIGNLIERDLAILVRDKIRLILNGPEGNQIADHDYFYPQDNLTLKETIDWINDWAGPDDFGVEIHLNFNSNPNVRGTEAYYAENDRYAKVFAREVAGVLKIPNRGAKHDSETYVGSLGFLRKLKCPSVLIECAYLSNAEDVNAIDSEKIARGIISAIEILFPKQNEEADKLKIIGLQKIVLDLISKILAILKGRKFGGTIKPMSKFSTTISGILVIVAGQLLSDFGFSETCGNEIVKQATLYGGAALAWYGRYRAGGINVFGAKI